MKLLKTLKTWVNTCNVTSYRDSVDGTWPRNVSKVGYVVTLGACSVCCRYLAIVSKGWYSYGLSRFGRTMWHVTTVSSSRLLYFRDASGSHNKLGTPWCNACRMLWHEARDESSDRNSVSCQSLATLWRYGMRKRYKCVLTLAQTGSHMIRAHQLLPYAAFQGLNKMFLGQQPYL
jgi:hypothetical protein